MFGGLFGGGSNPYDSEIDTYNKFPGHAMPYMHNGEWASGAYRGAISNFLKNDGVDYENNVMSQYQESPWAKYQTGELTNAANKAAAAGGYAGTPQEQEALAGKLQGLISQDQQKFYNNAKQPYEFGTQQAGNQAGQGLQANSQYWNYLKALAQAQMGQQGWNSANRGLGGFLGGIGNLAGLAGTVMGIPGVQGLLGMGGGSALGGMGGMMGGMSNDGGITSAGNAFFGV